MNSNPEPPNPLGSARLAPARWLLPTEAYTSEDWFRQEQEHLFRCCWYFAGMEDDVTDVGDFTCVTVGTDPIVVVRGEHGNLQAFHNICRHRGAQLLEGRGNLRHGISCFYHRWRYSLDGELTTVPQPDQFPGLCKEELGLLLAAVDSWNGMMFVHVDPEPSAGLREWLGETPDGMAPFNPLELEEIPVVRHELRANWKLFLENHVDGYHLWHLHAKSIKGLDHAHQDWRPTGRHWTFYEPPSRAGAHADAELTGLEVLPGHGPGGYGSSVQLLFPNLGVAGGSTFWATIQAIPVSAERTVVEIRTRIAPMSPTAKARALAQLTSRRIGRSLAKTPIAPALRTARLLRGHAADPDFVAEDLHAAESVQRGMHSSHFEVGPMAKDYENAITFFQQNILDYVTPRS
jgi:phenylpropionate dioxygenase-like ring-hydroxylating dioxygenase large terminal subunit